MTPIFKQYGTQAQPKRALYKSTAIMAIDRLKSYNCRPLIILTYTLLVSLGNIQSTSAESTAQTLLKISAVGDIMLGGTAEPVLQELTYDHPFEKVSPLLKDSHIVIGNLEGPLTNRETPYSEKAYLFKTPPELVAPALKQAGFTIMNLGNNHIMDFGIEGLKDTMNALDTNHIQYVGADMNISLARAGKIIEARNQKIGFLSYSLTFPKSFWANSNKPGTAFGHEHEIKQDIRRMKRDADIIIVSFHWGHEKSTELRDYQPLLAHAAIDEGAAMVIGHHPHVLQAVEHYKKGIILYSLGNFTFGSYSESAEFSVVATAQFKEKQFYSLQLTPINVLNVDVNFQPQILHDEDASKVIEHINTLSIPFNTRLKNQKGVAILNISAVSSYSSVNRH
jgi:poly-gamma-glutamate capsule biosynthesis protein CapA/YwtB (metallophosphatase superfamily)